MVEYKARVRDIWLVIILHLFLIIFLFYNVLFQKNIFPKIIFSVLGLIDVVMFLYLLIPKLFFSIQLHDKEIIVCTKQKIILKSSYADVFLIEKKRLFFSHRGLIYFLRFKNGDFNLNFLGPLLIDDFISDFNISKKQNQKK